MRLFLDCEFNGYKGGLISMALVAEDGTEWYEVVNPGEFIDPWVNRHVIPILHLQPVSFARMQQGLEQFLAQFDAVHIVADWPEDISYFCNALITGPGKRLDTPPLTMEVLRLDAPSELPHNALFDARGIRKYILEGEQA